MLRAASLLPIALLGWVSRRHALWRWSLAVLCVACWVTTAAFAQQIDLRGILQRDRDTGPRVALVVGVGDYVNAPRLPNPPRDARAIDEALKRLGFDSELVLDPDRLQLEAAVRRLGDRSRGADAALFFYAGHAIELAGRNWLLPKSVELRDDRSVRFEAVEMDAVLEQTAGHARVNFLFLDACRDNPFRLRLSGSGARNVAAGGLAQLRAATGTLIAFATQPGNVAEDGRGEHSPFTAALLEFIERPGMEVREMLGEVRRAVRNATNNQQIPWENSSLEGSFYFNPQRPPAVAAAPPQAAPTPPAATPSADDDRLYWESVRNSNSVAELELYLTRFPEGRFADLARVRIERLRQRPPAQPPRPPTQPAAPTPATQVAALPPGNWIADRRTGCRVQHLNPQPDESVTWSGGCANGLADGQGVMVLAIDGRDSGRFEGVMRAGRPEGSGIYVYRGNNRYEGEFAEGQRHGTGVMQYGDGRRYEGQWQNGLRSGRAVLTLADGRRYEAEYRNDSLTGTGSLTWPTGARYEGEFLNGNRHGRGVMTYASRERYDGEWRNDIREGTGAFTYNDGRRYEGDVQRDVWSGRGVMTWPNGDRYEGEFANYLRHGRGEMRYANGNTYVGDWQNGVRIGRGVSVLTSGWRYEGEWRNDAANGQGVSVEPNGNRYEGEYQNDRRHGRGTYIWTDGRRYEGEFRASAMTGPAVLTWPNGDRYEGEFQNGRRHGRGVLTRANGARESGEWDADRLVRPDQPVAAQPAAPPTATPAAAQPAAPAPTTPARTDPPARPQQGATAATPAAPPTAAPAAAQPPAPATTTPARSDTPARSQPATPAAPAQASPSAAPQVAARPAATQPQPDPAAVWARSAGALRLFGYLADTNVASDTAPARAAIRRYQLHAGEQQSGALTDTQRDQLVASAQNLQALLDAPRVSPAGVAADTLTGAEARYLRAAQHETGQGAARNDAEAIYWYRLAAADGSREALNNLGVRYSRGQGVARDMINAVTLWRAAAIRGEPNAAFNLGAAYERGIGVSTDAAAARRWYLVARNAGNQEARRALERVR